MTVTHSHVGSKYKQPDYITYACSPEPFIITNVENDQFFLKYDNGDTDFWSVGGGFAFSMVSAEDPIDVLLDEVVP